MDPLGAIFFDRIINSGIDPLKDQAVGMLHLAIVSRVSHGGIVHVDVIFLTKVPKLESGEGGAQIGNDPVGYSESMYDLLDELGCFGS